MFSDNVSAMGRFVSTLGGWRGCLWDDVYVKYCMGGKQGLIIGVRDVDSNYHMKGCGVWKIYVRSSVIFI